MPTRTFVLQRINPATGANLADNADLLAGDSFVYKLTCPADPAASGSVLVPDLTTMRNAGATTAKNYTNVAAQQDSNGVLSALNRAGLTGGYVALRQTTSDKYATANTYNLTPALIPVGLSFFGGHGGFDPDLTANNNVVWLVYDPQPTGGLLDANKETELIRATELPVVSVVLGGID